MYIIVVDYNYILWYNNFMKTENTKKFNKLPQRQKKYARTKLALLNSLLHELEKKSLSKIMIKELAENAEVSEPTFFNYFESKPDMLIYYIQLWSVEMNALALNSELKCNTYVETIKDIFKQTSLQIINNPQLMLEIIAFQAQGTKVKPHNITDAEKWFYFPKNKEIEKIEGMGLETILPPLITKAVNEGELREEIDKELLFLTLSSLFFGTALLILNKSPESYPMYLEVQLNQLLEGLSC